MKNSIGIFILKVLEGLNNFFISFNKCIIDRELIKVIHVKTYNNKSIHYIYLFGKKIYPFKIRRNNAYQVNSTQPVMYLKINRKAEYTINCIQHWVNIAHNLKIDFYFICDDKQLEYSVLSHVMFPDIKVEFLQSERKKLKTICETISTRKWINAACAQMTTFYHARENGISRFWAIDADDTSFCMSDNFCASIANIKLLIV